MTDAPLLRLNKLTLENYRCFEKFAIEFHPELTVLVAENGRGKTAVLDAIGISLGLFVDTISGEKQSPAFNNTDVRLIYKEEEGMCKITPTKFDAKAYIDGDLVQWQRVIKKVSKRARPTKKETKPLDQAAQQILQRVKNSNTEILPIIAFYGTGRLWSEHRLTERKKVLGKSVTERVSGYSDCLSSSSSFKGFVSWYEVLMNLARDPGSVALSTLERPEKLLAAVREATKVVLEPTGWCELDWDFEKKLLMVEHADKTRLPLSSLSDGVRNMIALVADLSHRCASLNPHLSDDAARRTPGILLIDEVDMHLHPGWQQKVIDLLRKAFPSMQMVLTTHSPHVLSTVVKESIRIIRIHDGVGLVETPQFQTRGVESADVLAQIMGVDPIPQVDEAASLSKYRALIDQGVSDTEDAKDLRERLIKHFGEQHPVILECYRMIQLMNFKKRLPVPKNQK